MDVINNTQADMLELLGRFKFLSTSQMQRLIGKGISYTREQLARLQERKYIKAYHLEKPTKAENIYYLTEAGKDVLLQNPKVFADDIKVPVGVPLVVRDYEHRKNFIDLHIALHQHLTGKGIRIVIFHAYFDKIGNNRTAHNLESKTKIPLADGEFYMPDGVMITENAEGSKEIYLLEMYNGKDTGRTIEQLAKHARAIALGTPGKKYGIPKNPSVLCAFEHNSIKDAVMKRLEGNERFAPVAQFFFFAALQKVQEDFEGALENLQGHIPTPPGQSGNL